MCPEDLVLLVTGLAITIACEQPPEVVALYSSIFVMLGDTLDVLVTQGEFLENCKKQCEETSGVC